MITRLLLLLLQTVLWLPAYGADCVDCAVKCCVQTAIGQVCAPVCQQECVATASAGECPARLPASAALDGPAVPRGMLLAGWQVVADQALGDIRNVAVQMHPDTPDAAAVNDAAVAAQPFIDAFMREPTSVPAIPALQAREARLLDEWWQATARDETVDQGAAQRLARSYTFASATAQLARSVYGGPPGAAAYAAWWAYRQPGSNATQALRVGLLAGAGLWAAQKAGDGSGVAVQVSESTSLAAALGGVAIAAAGGDEQALRSVFFDTGAAVLWQQGAQRYCLSATHECQNPAAHAALYQAGALRGWALAQLSPVAAVGGTPFPQAPAGQSVTPSVLAHPQGTLALEQGWAVSWQFQANLPPGILAPQVALVHDSALPPAPGVALSASPAAGFVCEHNGDTRLIWLLPANPRAGYVCRVMYQVGTAQEVLWTALQNPAVCAAKAQQRMDLEQSRGYRCKAAQGH